MHAKLVKRGVEKPWGRDNLPPPFAGMFDGRIGMVWFEPTPALDQLLVKYIFTSEALSVKVHPSDRQTALSMVRCASWTWFAAFQPRRHWRGSRAHTCC